MIYIWPGPDATLHPQKQAQSNLILSVLISKKKILSVLARTFCHGVSSPSSILHPKMSVLLSDSKLQNKTKKIEAPHILQ
jgi:hypothetical protein